MAIEDIKKELEKRFSEPLEEDYKRRIIFWNDEDHMNNILETMCTLLSI